MLRAFLRQASDSFQQTLPLQVSIQWSFVTSGLHLSQRNILWSVVVITIAVALRVPIFTFPSSFTLPSLLKYQLATRFSNTQRRTSTRNTGALKWLLHTRLLRHVLMWCTCSMTQFSLCEVRRNPSVSSTAAVMTERE